MAVETATVLQSTTILFMIYKHCAVNFHWYCQYTLYNNLARMLRGVAGYNELSAALDLLSLC